MYILFRERSRIFVRFARSWEYFDIVTVMSIVITTNTDDSHFNMPLKKTSLDRSTSVSRRMAALEQLKAQKTRRVDRIKAEWGTQQRNNFAASTHESSKQPHPRPMWFLSQVLGPTLRFKVKSMIEQDPFCHLQVVNINSFRSTLWLTNAYKLNSVATISVTHTMLLSLN
jgi:hypothetical protein